MNLRNAENPVAYWGARIALAFVTAVAIGSFFSYKQSQSEMAAGYVETRKAVEELQDGVKSLSHDLAYLHGCVDQQSKYSALPPQHRSYQQMPEKLDEVVKAAAK